MKLTLIPTICMRLARQETAATDYTVPMSVAAAGAVVTPLWIRRHAGNPDRRLVSQTDGFEQ